MGNQAVENPLRAAHKRLGGQMLGAARRAMQAHRRRAGTTQVAPNPLRPKGCRGTATAASLALLADGHRIGGVAPPHARSRGAGNATHKRSSTAWFREASLQCRLREFPVRKEVLVDFLLDALGGLGAEGSVGARIVGTRAMADLNRKFRGRRGPTDVLSFPSGEEEEAGLIYLGDIAVCGPVAAEAALEEGIHPEVELKRLLLHGLLHLLGYDHEADGGRMKRKERAMRKKLGI